MAEQAVDGVQLRDPGVEPRTIAVTVRYFAAARAAAGVPEEQLTIAVGVAAQVVSTQGDSTQGDSTQGDSTQGVSPQGVSPQGVSPQGVSPQRVSGAAPVPGRGDPVDGCTVGELLELAADRHGPALSRVLTRCSFLLDEVAVHGRQTPVRDGQVLDILPPFAGG